MLHLESVTKQRGSFCLDLPSLTVEEEVLSIVGPSGCGKTTLLSLVAGIIEPDSGGISLHGTHLETRNPEQRGAVLVFQDGALFPHMTARENVEYAADPMVDVGRLVATLEVKDVLEQRASTLSGGECQRIAVARALATDPDALLLDEPLANLDAPIRRRLRDDLRDILASLAIPVIYVTHDQSEAITIGDRIGVLHDGELEQIGTRSEVLATPATPFVASFTGSANVFRGQMTLSDGIQTLTWGSHKLETRADAIDPGTDVWFSVRPEFIQVWTEPDSQVRTGPETQVRPPEPTNCLAVTVTDRIFEGSTYRITVQPRGVDKALEVLLLPPVVERHGLAVHDELFVSFPPDAVHVQTDPR